MVRCTEMKSIIQFNTWHDDDVYTFYLSVTSPGWATRLIEPRQSACAVRGCATIASKEWPDMAEDPEPGADGTQFVLVENLGAPDVFADRAVGAFFNNGNAHITLASRRCDYSKQPNVYADVVVARLVMPLAAAEELARIVLDLAERARKVYGVTSPEAPKTLQ